MKHTLPHTHTSNRDIWSQHSVSADRLQNTHTGHFSSFSSPHRLAPLSPALTLLQSLLMALTLNASPPARVGTSGTPSGQTRANRRSERRPIVSNLISEFRGVWSFGQNVPLKFISYTFTRQDQDRKGRRDCFRMTDSLFDMNANARG